MGYSKIKRLCFWFHANTYTFLLWMLLCSPRWSNTTNTQENTDRAVLGAACIQLIKRHSSMILKSSLNFFMPGKPVTKSDPNCLWNNQNSFTNILVYFLFPSCGDLDIKIIVMNNSSLSQVFSTHLHSVFMSYFKIYKTLSLR